MGEIDRERSETIRQLWNAIKTDYNWIVLLRPDLGLSLIKPTWDQIRERKERRHANTDLLGVTNRWFALKWNLEEVLTDPIPDEFYGVHQAILQNLETLERETVANQVYTVRIASPFILTERQVKEKLGIGYRIVSVEKDTDVVSNKPVSTKDEAIDQIIMIGWKALARAFHPDLVDQSEIVEVEKRTEITKIINDAKKELVELLKEVRS